jgi:hypothetical protein
VAVETMLLHTSGEWISSTMRIPAVKQDAQGHYAYSGILAALEPKDQEKAKEIAAGIVDLWTNDKELAAYELYYEEQLRQRIHAGYLGSLTTELSHQKRIEEDAPRQRTEGSQCLKKTSSS